ncbi:MAG: aldo/keto reductase, partial [Candidatus Binatia bacterium]
LDDLVRAGKVLYLGCSNYQAWTMARAITLAEARGWNRFVSLQPQYNLLVRSIEREHFAACRELGIGILPWSPLAAGLLTGKITREHRPTEARLGQREIPIYRLYFTERAFRIVDELAACAKEMDTAPAALAIAWQLAKPEITSVILGARSIEQLDGTMAATALEVPSTIQARLDAATEPEPEYPNVMIDWIQGQLDPAARRPKKA